MTEDVLLRIAEALERISPPPNLFNDLDSAEAFLWHVSPDRLQKVSTVNSITLDLLLGIDQARDTLLKNTYQYAKGFAANNTLLWGSRGMGKSSLVKAIHTRVISEGFAVKLVEILREDLPTIGRLLGRLRESKYLFILFCDDLSFSHDDQHYKSLKAVLDGGIEVRPDNVIFYATSNRRHLMPREMIENEQSGAINSSETVDEKVSLSDRFGLWLGFHACSQDEYFRIIRGYCDRYGLIIPEDILISEAIEWQQTRGARSGRVAWQYFTDLAGRKGISL